MPTAALKFWKEDVNPGGLILEHIQVVWEQLQGSWEGNEYGGYHGCGGGFIPLDAC